MVYRINLVLAVLLCSFSATLHEAAAKEETDSVVTFYFIGSSNLLNHRIGSYYFTAIEKRQNIEKPILLMAGVSFGKRYPLWKWLRIQFQGMFHWGRSFNDTLVEQNISYSIKHSFKHSCAEATIQLVRSLSPYLSPFVSIGGGVNYLKLDESQVLTADPSQQVSLFTGIQTKRWSPHVNFGFGFDHTLNPMIGWSMAYYYRVWKPVLFDDIRDLPLDAVKYTETFFTHMLQINLLFTFTNR